MEEANDLIEQLFTALYGTDEWDDHDCEEKLEAWRKERGEDAKADWEWWAREAGSNDTYDICPPLDNQTRQGVIEAARRDLGPDVDLEVVEARDWNDLVTGEDYRPFAETRNFETVKAVAND